MHLAAVSMVRSECDIIESFVRHNAAFFDRLYILDHRSTDTTPDILRKLAGEGLPLSLSREGYGIFYQGPNMTHLIKRAFDDYPWDFIIPLDCDEFLRIPDRAALEVALADLDADSIGLSDVINYIPTESDDWNETDVLRRIVHRTKTIPDINCKIGKVIIPGAVIRQPGVSLNEDGVCIGGKPVPERRIQGMSLAHFPVRSVDQFTLRIILFRLAWASRSDYNPSWGWHYGMFFKQLMIKPVLSVADLTEAALLYVDIYLEPGQTHHQKTLVRDPVAPTYEQLRFTNPDDTAVLPPILDMMEFVIDELRAARMGSTGYAVPVALEAKASANATGNRVAKRAIANGNAPAHHTFQSFWHGEALSPYELFCLKSFIDSGYAVDLYTYDVTLAVPAGVRVCDAAELVSRDEVFVYEAEGFGKGSPSAFSNYFRYKLLAEKGGWWIDTDVVCLTDRVPVVNEFFARQDMDFVACGTMFFEPGHPIMQRCLAQAIKLGRTVKWGDTGPRLLTRVLEESGCLDRAVPASVCYPIHYSAALDMLRPSKTAVLAPQIESSLFLHVWNSTLVHRGVQKTFLPPKGSLLRGWMDKYPVDGWTGEYDDNTLEGTLSVKAELNASAEENRGLQAALVRQAADAAKQLAEVASKNEQQRIQLDAIWASTSWRLTAPLRASSRCLSALGLLGRRR
jgi:Glycosyl transferase family 2/Alpha 1,4-glycosyltransferase conserved region